MLLQGHEVLIGLEFGIGLAHGDELAQRGTQRALGLLVLLQLLLGEVGGVDFHLSHAGAGCGHGLVGLFLMLGIALHGVHQVGDKVGTALVVALDLAPGLFHILLLGHEAVVLAYAPAHDAHKHHNHGQGHTAQPHASLAHAAQPQAAGVVAHWLEGALLVAASSACIDVVKHVHSLLSFCFMIG